MELENKFDSSFKVLNKDDIKVLIKIKIPDLCLINYILYQKDFGLIQPHTSGSYDKHPFKPIYDFFLERYF
jgi:hypothetical protein